MICIINHLGWRRRESKTEYDSPPTLGLVGSGGVSSKVPTIYDYVSPSSEPVTSERLAVGCSTVATATGIETQALPTCEGSFLSCCVALRLASRSDDASAANRNGGSELR